MSAIKEFSSQEFLHQHIQSILAFYDGNVCDPDGGYFQNFYDDGSHFDTDFKQLVSSTRIVVNYANAYAAFGKQEYKQNALHGLHFVENNHWQNDTQTYAWTLRNNQPEDMTQQAYGYAFVLLAYSIAKSKGVIDSDKGIYQTYDLLEQRFWQPEFGLYADEISAEGELSSYRGQNANMHLCEAMIAAFEATEDAKFLSRAKNIAENITQRQADHTDGLVWEHFTESFDIDWEYNKDDPKNLYRPWGFQPGHQTEWTKLLLSIYRHDDNPAYLTKAAELFDRAYQTAWDKEHGGLIYGFDPDGNWCDDDKYFWVQAESLAAAAMLYKKTGETKYLEQYNALWGYAWEHMIDHEYGAWYRVLKRNNEKYSNEKSAAGAKCDYHTLGACFEVLRVIGS